MLGMRTKAPAITTKVMAQESSTLRWTIKWRSGTGSLRALPAAARCPRIGGKKKTPAAAMTSPSPATAKKGARQPRCRANSRPAGTPSTLAMEKAPITLPMAEPRRCGGTTSAMMEKAMEVAGPPKKPATMRAAISEGRPVAKPPSAVPTTRPSMAAPSAWRRSKRSRKNDPTSPEMAAAAV